MNTTESRSQFPVKRFEPFTGNRKKSIYNPKDIDQLGHGLNLLLNLDIKWGDRNELIVTDGRATLVLSPPSTGPAPIVNAHPFQVYPLDRGQVADADKANPIGYKFYAVRSGYVEYRPRWYNLSGSSPGVNGDYSYYPDPYGGGETWGSSLTFGDDVEQASPTGKLGFSGGYFAFDPAPEISGSGLNYGCYYSIWISIQDMVPNTLPTVQMQSHRFSPHNPAGLYPGNAFPTPTDDEEIFPIAIIQIVASTDTGMVIPPNFGTGLLPPDVANGITTVGAGFISQILWTNIINRYDRLGLRYVGDFNVAQYRTYYSGDLVFWDAGGDPTKPDYGWWLCTVQHTNGAAVTKPADTGAFFYFANPNPPSVTNPP